jgi:glycosyltransferase involved in cell wall biosynthesis
MSNLLTDYRKISVALIATVFNEKDNIGDFLESYKKQSILAQEFIIVDAVSDDGTDRIIEQFSQNNPHLKIRLFRKKTNRSQARNFAVSQTQAEYLAFTDAGCILDQLWLEELLKKLVLSQKRVVGGFFRGMVHSKLEEAIVPYFLQLPKNVNERNFVPTTRSLLIEKKLWQEMGGLNEKLKLSEDYQLMLRIKQRGIAMAFAKKAIVYWEPPHSFLAFVKKIGSFAKSDVEAGIIRPKVLSIFARYLFFLILIFNFNLIYFLGFFSAYVVWSIYKNKHNCPESWYLLPILQISSDFMVMGASLLAIPKFNSRAF